MVYILSTVSLGKNETFVGNFATKEKALEVVQAAAKLVVKPVGNDFEYVAFESPEFRLRVMNDGSPPAPTTTDYIVNSQSDYTKTYTVTVEDQTQVPIKCTCPDHQHRGNFCKHMRQVKFFGTKSLMLAPVAKAPAVVPSLLTGVVGGQAVVPVKPQFPHHIRQVNVQSESDWRKMYLVGVDISGYPVNCTCPSFEHRRETCKHMKKIALNHFRGGGRVRP